MGEETGNGAGSGAGWEDEDGAEAETEGALSDATAPASALRLADLERCHCRFPVGVATGAGQLFCAGPRVEPSPYCVEHQEAVTGPRPLLMGRRYERAHARH